MYKESQVILAEIKTNKTLLAITSQLHHREEKNGRSHYKGNIAFRICEFAERDSDLTYFLSKKEAKYLFYRILHNDFSEPILFHGGKSGEKPIAKVLKIEMVETNRGKPFKIEIAQGEGEVKSNGAIAFKNGSKTEVATIYLWLHEIKQHALECLDYIHHEESVAQLNGYPLYDQIIRQPISFEEQEDLIDGFQAMIEIEKAEQIPGEYGKTLDEKEEIRQPKELLKQLEYTLNAYIQEVRSIPVSKEELQEVLEGLGKLQPYVDALKAVNQLR